MIKVKVHVDPFGGYRSIEISGHAGYDEYGKDIVCAAISALAQTMALGLEKVVGIKVKIKKKDGYFLLKVPKGLSAEKADKTNIIMETFILGIEDISESYPSNIQVDVIEEV